jgi:hypothetical protein
MCTAMKSLDTVIGVATTSKVRESATLLVRSVGNKKTLKNVLQYPKLIPRVLKFDHVAQN